MPKRYANQSIERRARSRARERMMGAGTAPPNCNITRGFSYTHFPHNTLEKHLLDRCGRAVKINAA